MGGAVCFEKKRTPIGINIGISMAMASACDSKRSSRSIA